MKFGIIGSGAIASIHAKAIAAMDGCILHSVFNHRGESAGKLASVHGIRAYSDLAGFLTDPELDIVTVCTPSGVHLEPAVAALTAGKHVIVEKPLEITTERIDFMIEAAKANGKTLACVLNRRYSPAMDVLRQAAYQGRFGRLTSASCYVKGFLDQAYYDSAPWRGTWGLGGGGVLMDPGIRAIDALIHVAGPVRSVRAVAGRLAHAEVEVEDTAIVIVEFETGACGVIEASTCAWSKDGHPTRVQLTGTEGSAFLADDSFEVWDFKNERPEDAAIRANLMRRSEPGLGANDPAAFDFEPHRRNFEEIVTAIREGREPSTSAAEARKAVAVIEAAYRSAQNLGGRVMVE